MDCMYLLRVFYVLLSLERASSVVCCCVGLWFMDFGAKNSRG